MSGFAHIRRLRVSQCYRAAQGVCTNQTFHLVILICFRAAQVGRGAAGVGALIKRRNGDSFLRYGHRQALFCHICVLCISLNLVPNGVFPGIFRCGELLTPLRIAKPVEHCSASGLARCNQRLFCTIVGQGVCRRCRNSGDKLVGRIDIDGQRDVLIVRALDYHGHCAHRAGGFHVIFLNRQDQLAIFHLRTVGVIGAGQVDRWCAVGHCAVLLGSFQRGQGGERHSVGLFVAVYNGQRGFLSKVGDSGLGDVASRGEAALLQGVILRGLLHQGHCGSDVLAVAHTGIVKSGGHGVVCSSVQGHVVEGHAGNVRVCRAIIGLIFYRN